VLINFEREGIIQRCPSRALDKRTSLRVYGMDAIILPTIGPTHVGDRSLIAFARLLRSGIT